MTDFNPYSSENIPSAPSSGDYNPYSQSAINSDTNTRINLDQSINKNPDQAAEALHIATDTSTPIDAVNSNFDQLKRSRLVDQYIEATKDVKATRSFLQDPVKAPIVHDDIQNMTSTEKALSFLSASSQAGLHDLLGAGATVVEAFNPFNLNEQDLAQAYKNDPVGLQKRRDSAGAVLSRFAKSQTHASNDIMAHMPEQTKDAYGNLEYQTLDPSKAAYLHPVKIIGDVVRSLPTTAALALTTFLTKGAAGKAYQAAIDEGATVEVAQQAGIDAATKMATEFGAASEGAVGYGQQYNQTQDQIEKTPFSQLSDAPLDKFTWHKPGDLVNNSLENSPEYQKLLADGYDPNAARLYLSARGGQQAGVGAGLADAWGNALGGRFLGKIIGEGGALAPRIAKGVGVEAGEEAFQSPLEQLSGNAAIQFNADPNQTLMQGVVESLLQGGVIGGVSGGTLAGVLGGANQAKAKQAEQTAQMIEQLNNLTKASKVLTRSPETYEQFIQHASENGPVSHLYIDANALMQTGLAEQVAALSPSVNEQLPLAAQTGGKISIPVGEYTTKIAPNEVSQPLVEHLTVDPNDYSRVEANHYMQTEGEQLKQSMEAILAPKLEESNFRQSKESLKVKFLNELNDLGHWSNPANEAYASHLANFFSVIASRAGMTPEEMHAQFPVNFASEMAQGSYGQVLPNAMPEGMEVGDADKLAAMYRKEDQAKSVLLGQTNPRLTEDGLKVNAYLNTFSHSVDKSALNHIKKNHGDESTELNRGNLPITDEDISKIPDIIKDYDGVRFDLLSSYGKPVIAYVKKVSDGVLLYMEEVHNKRHDLSALSMRKYPTTTDVQNILKNASQNVRNGDGHENSIGKPPKSIKEIDKDTNVFNQDPTINRGSFNPETLTIALLKDANYSTFLHETGHFFLETQFSLASQLDKKAEDLGLDMLSEGEKGILNDTNALLKWFWVSDLNTWFAMNLDEKRSYHEQFARGFEAYLYEGKAPSIELAPLFQRFADWLKRVYQDIKSLNVTLNDEVRSVFDRMLASDAEIAQAKQARSMMALFAKQEDSPMSSEEFAEYQDVLTRWTDTAQEQLQSRLLRDLVWLGKAKPKVLKALQKEAKEKRRELRMGIKTQVMSEPVYRAWALLTGKITKDNKIAPFDVKPKSNPNIVEPDKDSLFTAIAKLGGLNKQELRETWDLDPAYKAYSGVFGKPVWRKEGGLSIDGMTKALVQYGYLPTDAHGKADIRDLEDTFDAELRGNKQYSNEYDYSRLEEKRHGEQVVNPYALTAVRLYKGALITANYSDEMIKALTKRKMVTTKEGFDPELVNDLILDENGQPEFKSGDELLRALVDATPPNEHIDALTDSAMLEQYGDIATPEALEQAANYAILNDYRAHVVATEASALAKITGKPRVLVSAAKQWAAEIIGRKKVRDVLPSQFTSAQAKAAKSADQYFKAGDFANAEAEKKNELFNSLAAKAALDAKTEIAKIDKFFKKVVSGKDAEVGKVRDMAVVNTARAVLGLFGYGGKAKNAMDYLKTVEQYDPQAYLVLSESVQFAQAMATNTQFKNTASIKDLTVEQLRSLSEEISALWHLAKRDRTIEIDGQLVNRAQVADDLYNRLDEIGIPEHSPGDTSAVTPKEERMMRIASLKAVARRVESWVDLKDGQNKMGVFRKYLWTPIREAADKYRADKLTYLKAYRAAVASIGDSFRRATIDAPELNYTFGKDSGGVAMNELLHALLHTGNESNKRKLLLGRGWATVNQDDSLDSTRWDAFVDRMIKEGVLTKVHYDFAQTVWDLLEQTKELAQKTHRDAFGRYFAEVTADEFTTPFGTYRGGYVPASVDSRIVKDIALKKLIEEGKDSMSYSFPSASKGFTMSRVEYNRPLLLDLRTLPQHIDKVLLFSHLEMPVQDATKLLNNNLVKGALNKQDPAAINDMLIPWLNRTAHQQVTTPIAGMPWMNRFLNTLRNRTSMATMFANVSNTAQQITGFSLAAVKVKPTHLLSATVEYMKAPKQLTAQVAEMSLYMSHRMENEIGAMMGNINEILLNPTTLEKAQSWTEQHTFFMQSAVDNVMGPIIWLGAFNQALEEAYDDKAAVRIADAVVRQTQGSSTAEDVSRLETGNAGFRLLTLFAGYFNMQANLLGTEFAKVSEDMGLRKGAGRAFMLFILGFYVPAMVAEAIAQSFRGGPGDDDKDGDYLDDWLMALTVYGPLRNATAMVPFAGQLINSAVARFNHNPTDDRVSLSPVINTLEASLGVGKDLVNLASGDGHLKQTVKDVGSLISLTIGLPAGAAARPLGYLAGVAEGKVRPTGPVDAARGLVTGTPSPESRTH